MSLDLGELVGSIGLDITPLERSLAAGDAGIKGFASSGEATAKAAGDGIGVAFAMGLATVPAEAQATAAGVKAALDQIPADTKVTAGQVSAAWGVSMDEVARLMDELPKNANGTVKETSAEFRKLPYEVKGALLEVKGNAALALAQIPPEARKAGQEAATEFGAGLAKTKPEAEAAGRRAGESFADGFGRYAANAGKVAGAAVGGALSVGVIDNINLEQGRLVVAAQLGLTEKEAARIGRIAGRVYAHNFGDSIESVNGAVAAVISSIRGMRSASETEIGRATRMALAYADVFEIDVPRAVSVAGTVIQSGLARNSREAFDLITQASSRVPAALREDVLDAAEEYSQFFHSLGYDGPAAFAMLVNGAKDGMYGIDKAGDAVKEFTIRSTDMSTSTKAAYKKLGLNAREMADDILAGGGKAQKATQKVVDSLLSVESPSKRANLAIALFGTPLEDLSVRQVPQFLKSLKGSDDAMKGWEGSARQMASTAGGGTANSIETMKRKVIEWGRSVIEAHGPTTMLAGALAAFGPAALSVIGPVAQLVSARATQTAAAAAAASAETAAAGATKAGWISSAATAMVSAVRMAAAWVIAMGPIAIAIAAIAGIAYLIYKYWDEIKAATMAVWDWVVGFIKDHVELIVLVVTGPLGLLVLEVVKHWDEIKAFTAAALDWVIDKAKAWGPYLLGVLLGPLGLIVVAVVKHWDQVKAGTTRVWDAVTDYVKAIPGKLLGFFMKWTLAGKVIEHWEDAKTGTIRVATTIVNWVADLPGRILDKLSSLNSRLRGVFLDAFQAARDAAQERAEALLTFVESIPGKIKNKFSGAKTLLSQIGGWIVQGLVDGIGNAAHRVLEAAQSLVDKIPGPIRKAMGISSPSKVMAEIGKHIVDGLILGITSKDSEIKDRLDKITDLIERTMNRRYKNDKLAEAAARAVVKGLQDERRELLANEQERDRIDAKLEVARERLRDMRQEARDYARSVQDAIVAFGNITQFTAPDPAEGGVRRALTADDIIGGLKDKAADAFEYTAAMEQLAAMGLSQDYIDQLTAAGVEGGLETARALLAGGQSAIDQVNFLNTALNLAGADLGNSLSTTMYASGISAAQDLVNGLENDQQALERAGRKLARSFIRALRDELGSGLGELGIDISDFHTKNDKGSSHDKTEAASKKATSFSGSDSTEDVLVAKLEELREAVDRGTVATKTQPRTAQQLARKDGKK